MIAETLFDVICSEMEPESSEVVDLIELDL